VHDRTQQLKELGEDWAAAELHGDTAFLKRALADDFVGIGPRGFMLTKEQWLSRHDSGKLKYESFELDEVWIRVHGDALIVTGCETVKGKYEDHDLQDQFRATLIFVKQQECWLLAGLHLSPIAGRP
jgi:ketosteroid isomerase-like protein